MESRSACPLVSHPLCPTAPGWSAWSNWRVTWKPTWWSAHNTERHKVCWAVLWHTHSDASVQAAASWADAASTRLRAGHAFRCGCILYVPIDSTWAALPPQPRQHQCLLMSCSMGAWSAVPEAPGDLPVEWGWEHRGRDIQVPRLHWPFLRKLC